MMTFLKQKVQYLFLLPFLFILASCESTNGPGDPGANLPGDKLLVVSEGAFGAGNGSLGVISLNDTTYTSINPAVGDAPNDVLVHNGKIYLLVTGSNTLLTLDTGSFAIKNSLSFDLKIPNKMILGPNNTMFVTQRASNEVAVVDLTTNTFKTPLSVGTGTIAAAMLNGVLYSAAGKDSLIKVGTSPANYLGGVYLDANPEIVLADSSANQIIVMTSGDFNLNSPPKIFWLDQNLAKLDSLILGTSSFTVSDLFFATGILYAISEGKLVVINPFTHHSSPSSITNPAHTYYKGIIDEKRQEVYLGESTFISNGVVDVYDLVSGTFLRSFTAGIAPAHFAFYQ